MQIKVMYTNGKTGIVESYQLDELIASGKIKKFRRSEGWVIVGKDRIRHAEDLDTTPKRKKSSGKPR